MPTPPRQQSGDNKRARSLGAKYSRKLLQVPVTSQPAAKHAPGDCSQHTDSRRASSARPPAPAPIGRQGRDTHFGAQNLP